MSKSPAKKKGGVPLWFLVTGTGIVLLLAGLIVFLVLHERARVRREAHRREEALRAGPQVLVQAARSSPPEQTLVLQAEARPFATATLYAKVSGYLRQILVDKGDRVTANEVVAIIEAPEIDRQYQAALADARNKWANARRARRLVGPGVVSVQDADLAMTQAQMAEANLKAQETERSYEILRAPFDGTVTARFADPGALMQAATSGQTGALPVVTISQLDRLRVYIYLAQSDAAYVRVGDPAMIRVPERLGKTYSAKVARVSGELDPRTRMMLTELDMDNRGGELLPGGFVEATLKIHTPRYVELSSEALVLRGDKTLVAVVTPQKTVHFQEVKVGSDDGQTVRLLSGVEPGQQVALNLGDAVAEGKNVRPIEAGAADAAAGAGKSGEGKKGGASVGGSEHAGSGSGDSSGARQTQEAKGADPRK